MMEATPRLPDALCPAALDEWTGEERSLCGVRISGAQAENKEFYQCEIRQSVLENCRLDGCDLTGCAFYDVEFRGCSLRNSILADAYFERCCLTESAMPRLNSALFSNSELLHAGPLPCWLTV